MQTPESIKIIIGDTVEMIKGMRRIPEESFTSRNAVTGKLRDAKIKLSAAFDQIDTGKRGEIFYRRLDEARRFSEEAQGYF